MCKMLLLGEADKECEGTLNYFSKLFHETEIISKQNV